MYEFIHVRELVAHLFYDQASLQRSVAAQENSLKSTTAASEGCWLTTGLELSRASMPHPACTRPPASLTAVISAGSPPARRERQEIELHSLKSWMTVFSAAWSPDSICHWFPAALDSSWALPRCSGAQAEDDCGPSGQQLHAVTRRGFRWEDFVYFWKNLPH